MFVQEMNQSLQFPISEYFFRNVYEYTTLNWAFLTANNQKKEKE